MFRGENRDSRAQCGAFLVGRGLVVRAMMYLREAVFELSFER